MTTSDLAQPAEIPAAPPPKWTWTEFFALRLYWTALILVWYVLLLGPLFWYWHHSVVMSEPSWVEFCYRPLAYVCEECPPIRMVVNAYLDLWLL